MFSEFKIVNKYRCGRTKITRMVTGAVAKQMTSDLKEELLLSHLYRFAADGTSDKGDKFLLVLVKYIDKDSGLIATSLTEMPNIKSGSTAQQMYDPRNEVKETFPLDSDNKGAKNFL